MKNLSMYLLLSLLVGGLMFHDIQADRGRAAAAGLGGFAAGAVLGTALGARPVVYYDDYYDPYYYEPYGPYPYDAPYYTNRYYGYRPYLRHNYYDSPDGAPFRPKN